MAVVWRNYRRCPACGGRSPAEAVRRIEAGERAGEAPDHGAVGYARCGDTGTVPEGGMTPAEIEASRRAGGVT